MSNYIKRIILNRFVNHIYKMASFSFIKPMTLYITKTLLHLTQVQSSTHYNFFLTKDVAEK